MHGAEVFSFKFSAMNFTRLLGYILLIGGLALVSVNLIPRGGVIKAMCIQQWEAMPHQQPNTRDDVLLAMEKVARSAWNEGSWPIGGGLIIFIGGVLLDMGSRRKEGRKGQPNDASDSK
jgi:hypothetical protein